MLYVAQPRLGRHVEYDSDATRRAALTYARGEMQRSMLLGWTPWDGTLPARPDVVGLYRPESIAGLLGRLNSHGFACEPHGLRGMRITRDRSGMLARLRTGRMHGIQPELNATT